MVTTNCESYTIKKIILTAYKLSKIVTAKTITNCKNITVAINCPYRYMDRECGHSRRKRKNVISTADVYVE